MSDVIERLPSHPLLGRHVEHDERSRMFAFTAPRTFVERTTYWDTGWTVLNQNIGACTGYATAHWLNCAVAKPLRRKFNRRRIYRDANAVDIYSRATVLDEFDGTYPPTDTGSSGLAVAKVLRERGIIDRYEHTFSFNDFRFASQNQPVIVGTVWTDAMFVPDKLGIIRTGPVDRNTIVGGHEYLCYGIDYGKQLVAFRNSWSRNWGNHGDFFMYIDEFENLIMNHDGDCTVFHGTGLP